MIRPGHAASLWRYRHFIMAAITGELRSRFASSRFGTLWFILHPLAMAAIYALVLSRVLGARLGQNENEMAYSIYLLAGMAGFNLFQETASRCLTVFIDNANALKKIAFPRIALPMVVLGSSFLNQLFLLVAIVAILAMFGHYPTVHWVALPVAMLVAAMLALGLGVFLGLINVFVRDVGQVMVVVFQLWFWLTPIVYPIEILPEGMRPVVEWNPVTPITRFYQDVILDQTWPDFASLLYPAALAIVLVTLSLFVFRRASAELVDVL